MAQANIEESVDRISSLPDSILGHILSFMPTKVAVSTCILLYRSRWRDIFPFSNNLDFDQSLGNNPNDTRLFMDFVDQFIMLMNGTSIDKFRLKCSDDVDPSRVHSWICAALCSNARELDLCIGRRKTWNKYSGLFNLGSNTLVVLKLEGTGFSLNVLACICFPCLQTLHLQSIKLAKKDYPIQMLVSSCPILEDLLIVGCYTDSGFVLSFSSPSLKRFTIHNPYHQCPYKLVLDTPSLAYLKFDVYKRERHILKNLRSLREAHISNWVDDKLIFEGLDNVKSLYLSSHGRQFLQKTLEVLEELPLLKNLTRLVLTCITYLKMSVVMKLLKSCPNLEELVTDGSIYDGYDVPRCVPSRLKSIDCALFCYRGVPDHREDCVPSRLKSIECSLFYSGAVPDHKEEAEPLKYFLKNANMLEKMRIHIWYQCQLSDKLLKTVMKTLKKLAKVQRRSKTCEINVFFHSNILKEEDQVFFREFCHFNSVKITFVFEV